jgi:hypothetical protein
LASTCSDVRRLPRQSPSNGINEIRAAMIAGLSRLQELVMRRAAQAPENIGRGLPEQTKERQLEIVRVRHHVRCHPARELLLHQTP